MSRRITGAATVALLTMSFMAIGASAAVGASADVSSAAGGSSAPRHNPLTESTDAAVADAAAATIGASPSVTRPVPSTSLPSESPSEPSNQPDAGQAGDEASARVIAHKYGHDVLVTPLTTATNEVFAHPDGTLELKAEAVPVRAKVGNDWKALDLALAPVGGYLAPSVTAEPVQFSRGGSGPLARVQDATGTWVSESSPFGTLPAPSIDGATAKYADVLPGVDLVLTATSTGMSEVLVVKSATAAKNPKLSKVSFGIAGSAVSTDSAGNARSGAKGTKGLIASTPTWWDSSDGSTAAGPGGMAMPQPVKHSVTSDSVTLDAAAAAGATKVQYPVFVDPDWSARQYAFWYIDRAYPTQSYLNGNYASGVQRVGYVDAAQSPQDGRTHLARAYWNFDTSAIVGKQIIGTAHFNTSLNGAYNCSIMHSSYLEGSVAPIGGTWNSESTYGDTVIDTETPGGCGAAVGWNATSSAVWASGGTTSTTIGIRSTDEGNNTGWQKWNQGASLDVQYNTYPNATSPITFTYPARNCSTNSGSPVYLDGAAPIAFKTSATDPDAGQNLATTFAITPLAGGQSYGTTTASEAQGDAVAHIDAGSLPDGEYSITSYANDGYANGPSSVACYFQIQSTVPAVPTITVTSSGAPEVGKPMTITIGSSPTDAAALFAVWWVDGSGNTTPAPLVTQQMSTGSGLMPCDSHDMGVHYVCPDAGSPNATNVTVAPTDRFSTLWVATYTNAGRLSSNGTNVGAYRHVTATVDSVGVSLAKGHVWDSSYSSMTDTTVPDLNTTASSTDATTISAPLSNNIALTNSDPLQLGSASTPVLSYHDGTPSSVTAPLDANGSFTASAWLYLPSAHASPGGLAMSGHQTPSGSSTQLRWYVGSRQGYVFFCAGGVCAEASGMPTDQWLMITGVWDNVNNVPRLYVQDFSQEVADADTSYFYTTIPNAAAGPVDIGGEPDGYTSDLWDGLIYRPAVFPGVISGQQLANLFATTDPNAN